MFDKNMFFFYLQCALHLFRKCHRKKLRKCVANLSNEIVIYSYGKETWCMDGKECKLFSKLQNDIYPTRTCAFQYTFPFVHFQGNSKASLLQSAFPMCAELKTSKLCHMPTVSNGVSTEIQMLGCLLHFITVPFHDSASALPARVY